MNQITLGVAFSMLIHTAPEVSAEPDQCQRDYDLFLQSKSWNGEDSAKFWAVKMSDAHASFPWDGMTEGASRNIGSFFSCQEAEADAARFMGQYCLTFNFVLPEDALEGDNAVSERGVLKPLLPPDSDLFWNLPLAQLSVLNNQLGFCVPDSCTEEEVQTLILNNITASSAREDGLYNAFALLDCQSKLEEPQLTVGDKIVIALLTLFGVLIIAGTGLDMKTRLLPPKDKAVQPPALPLQLLLAFSASGNTKRLLDTSSSKKPQMIPCLDGIRFWSMIWVVCLHTYDFATNSTYLPTKNEKDISQEMVTTFNMRFIYNPIPSVDSFFVLGGCLLAYITFKEMDRSGGKINLLMFFLHRYIRITGVYAVVVALAATLYKFADWGLISSSQLTAAACVEGWWRNLLYVNNFPPEEFNICLGQTWYLSAEMQMFLCTPALLLPMWHLRRRFGAKAALACCLALLVAFWAVILALTITNGWNAQILFPNEEGENYMIDYYYKPWTRCPPYIIGIGLGFVLHYSKGRTIKINWLSVCCLWAASLTTLFCVTYCLDVMGQLRAGTEPSDAANAIYNTFARSAWGLALSWVIFACFHGYGGFINSFLSWEAFGPLGKLSFNVYLVHYPLVQLMDLQFLYPVVIQHMLMVILVLNAFVISLVIAFFLAIFFEMPIITWDKILLGKLSQKMSKSN